MTFQSSYLSFRSNGKASFRMAVPKDLRHVLKKREIKQLILHQDMEDVRRRATDLAASWKEVFQKLRSCMSTGKKNEASFRLVLLNLLAESEAGSIKIDRVEFDPENVDKELEALSRHLPGLKAREPSAAHGASTSSIIHPLSDVIAAYCAERKAGGAWTAKTLEANLRTFDELVEILGNVAIDAVDKACARKYKEVLLALPKHYRTKPEFKGRPIGDVIASPVHETLSTKTVNNRIEGVSALFKWGVQNGYCRSNPFSGISVKSKTRPADKRAPFADDELLRIFGPGGFVVVNAKRPSRYWIPLIALYSGARLEEIAQLHVGDIIEKDGLWCLNVNDEGEKRVKSAASKRLIPLHLELLELGLLEFIANQAAKGETRVFPDLQKARDGYGQSFQKWFGREKTKAGFPGSTKSFHSLRHTFIDRLRNLGIEEAKLAALVGHTNNSVTSLYGKGYIVDQLKAAVEELSFRHIFDCLMSK